MVSQYEHGPDFQTPNEAEIDRLNATITALRDRVAEVERERDHWQNAFGEAFNIAFEEQARSTAAEAAIARLRDEVIEEAAKVLDDRAAGAKLNAQAFRDTQNMPAASNECRRMVSYEACAATIRALKSNRDTHHETR